MHKQHDCPKCGMTCPHDQQDCAMTDASMTMADHPDWAKVLGELIADHELRIGETIARAAALPPELAEQVATAVRLLHESPPIERAIPQPVAPPKVARIERDEQGNLVPIYADN